MHIFIENQATLFKEFKYFWFYSEIIVFHS